MLHCWVTLISSTNLGFVWERGANRVPSYFEILFLLKIIFFMFSNNFEVMISKMNLKKTFF